MNASIEPAMSSARLCVGARALHRRLWELSRNEHGYAYAGQSYLSEDLCCSIASVRRYTRELEAANMLRVRQTGLNQPNHYWILVEPVRAQLGSRTAQIERSKPLNLSDPNRSECALQTAQPERSKPLNMSAKLGVAAKNNTKERQRLAREPEPAAAVFPGSTGKVTDLEGARDRRRLIAGFATLEISRSNAEKWAAEESTVTCESAIAAFVERAKTRAIRNPDAYMRSLLQAARRGELEQRATPPASSAMADDLEIIPIRAAVALTDPALDEPVDVEWLFQRFMAAGKYLETKADRSAKAIVASCSPRRIRANVGGARHADAWAMEKAIREDAIGAERVINAETEDPLADVVRSFCIA